MYQNKTSTRLPLTVILCLLVVTYEKLSPTKENPSKLVYNLSKSKMRSQLNIFVFGIVQNPNITRLSSVFYI